MTLLTWNIRHGGGARIGRIVEELTAYDADVIALTEYRADPGRELCSALREHGWPHVETTNPTGKENGIVVFSRVPMRRASCPASPEHRVRWLEINLPEHGSASASSTSRPQAPAGRTR